MLRLLPSTPAPLVIHSLSNILLSMTNLVIKAPLNYQRLNTNVIHFVPLTNAGVAAGLCGSEYI
jgi:hypothetical protein